MNVGKENIIEQAVIDAEVKFWQENRKNFSKQADDVIEKLKKGEKLKDSDYYILLHTDQDKINEAIELDNIKDRIQKGNIEYKDVDFLINLLGNTGKFNNALHGAFYKKADEVNLNYALEHKEEFTKEEIQKRIKKVKEHKEIKEIIEEELLQI